MHNLIRQWKAALVVLALYYCSSALANDFALLIGVGDYPDLPVLEGPRHDVEAVAASLQNDWLFPSDNIVMLRDTQATKEDILQHLDKLYWDSQAGDNIFIYFSGHGTSYFDLRLKAPLAHTTGALVPYDYYREENAEGLVEKLIIGNRDLRPRLERFDRGGRHLFVAIDACYAGSTVRGRGEQLALPVRYLDLFSIVGESIGSYKAFPKLDTLDSEKDQSYPYNNIYYLGASSQYEEAVDISSKWLHLYPTVDGKPHGAFTDSVLRVLRSPLLSDYDKNGHLTYYEFKEGVRGFMENRLYNHSPQGLPSIEDDVSKINNSPVFFLQPKN